MDHPVNEVIILAGGLGTRLRPEIGDLPKAMAPVNGEPFLKILLRYLNKQGMRRVILALGYQGDLIRQEIGDRFEDLEIVYSFEKEPMGTGGAMKLALEQAKSSTLFVLNGDTYFDINLSELATFHEVSKSVCTLALKQMNQVDRYGGVETDSTGKIAAFREKQFFETVTINGGVYCINKGILIHYPVNTPFSFETNYLEKNPGAKKLYGCVFDNYFIDIGVPEDYHRFEEDTKK